MKSPDSSNSSCSASESSVFGLFDCAKGVHLAGISHPQDPPENGSRWVQLPSNPLDFVLLPIQIPPDSSRRTLREVRGVGRPIQKPPKLTMRSYDDELNKKGDFGDSLPCSVLWSDFGVLYQETAIWCRRPTTSGIARIRSRPTVRIQLAPGKHSVANLILCRNVRVFSSGSRMPDSDPKTSGPGHYPDFCGAQGSDLGEIDRVNAFDNLLAPWASRIPPV